MNNLIEAIDAARPERPGSRYTIGYDDGLCKAKQIIQKVGVVSVELYKAVKKERDLAVSQLEAHGFLNGRKKPDVVSVVRCGKCKWYDPDSEYCQFWHGCRHPGHYCGEGEKKDG